MLDIFAIIGLILILLAPIWVYMLDRFGFEEAGR